MYVYIYVCIIKYIYVCVYVFIYILYNDWIDKLRFFTLFCKR